MTQLQLTVLLSMLAFVIGAEIGTRHPPQLWIRRWKKRRRQGKLDRWLEKTGLVLEPDQRRILEAFLLDDPDAAAVVLARRRRLPAPGPSSLPVPPRDRRDR